MTQKTLLIKVCLLFSVNEWLWIEYVLCCNSSRLTKSRAKEKSHHSLCLQLQCQQTLLMKSSSVFYSPGMTECVWVFVSVSVKRWRERKSSHKEWITNTQILTFILTTNIILNYVNTFFFFNYHIKLNNKWEATECTQLCMVTWKFIARFCNANFSIQKCFYTIHYKFW